MTIRINWRLYYKEFSAMHGGNPVVYRQNKETGRGGFLLFRDGWMYSLAHPSGPEVAPADEKDALTKVRDYWLIREAVLQQAYREMKELLFSLASEQDRRTAPLMTVDVVDVEDEQGNRSKKMAPMPVDFDLLLSKAKDIHSDIRECQDNLRNLQVPPERKPESCHAALITAEFQVLEQL